MSEAKTALVTAAAGTMGSSRGKGLAEDGVRVVLADITEALLLGLAEQLPVDTFTSVFYVSDEQAYREAV